MAGGAQAKMSTWFSKPNQSLISKVTKKRVGFKLKMFVFALLKIVQNRAKRNSGRILRLFNCNDRGFLLLREAPKAKFLPGLVSPIKVWFKRLPKKGSDSTWKFLCLRSWNLSKTGLSGILDVFCDYLTAVCSTLVRSRGLCRIFAYRTRQTQCVVRLFVRVAYVGSLLIEGGIRKV